MSLTRQLKHQGEKLQNASHGVHKVNLWLLSQTVGNALSIDQLWKPCQQPGSQPTTPIVWTLASLGGGNVAFGIGRHMALHSV